MIRITTKTVNTVPSARVMVSAGLEMELLLELAIGVQMALEKIAGNSARSLEAVKRDFCTELMEKFRNES